ncbi:MAG TPA: hypothetical protein VKU19_25135 [Bryobacteraceae bacterium]|nr:hypothetical protein [Bryobacteraceae bacterium]
MDVVQRIDEQPVVTALGSVTLSNAMTLRSVSAPYVVGGFQPVAVARNGRVSGVSMTLTGAAD